MFSGICLWGTTFPLWAADERRWTRTACLPRSHPRSSVFIRGLWKLFSQEKIPENFWPVLNIIRGQSCALASGKGSMRLFVKKNSLKLVFLSSCIDRGHGWAATAIFAQWLHADIPKRGLSNDEKADFKGNCIRFIGASIRVCEKKFPETGFSFILIWSKAMFWCFRLSIWTADWPRFFGLHGLPPSGIRRNAEIYTDYG